MPRAIIYLSPDSTADRQERAVTQLCDSLGLVVTTRATTVDACVQLIAARLAEVVVAATDPRNGLRHAVTLAGGRVEFARDRTRLPTLADWLRRAIGRGVTPHQIGRAVDESTIDVSRIMNELGIRPTDFKDETNT